MISQQCISTSPSAASIRINTPPFSSANPSSCFETTTLSLPFPRRSRKFGILACDQSNARNYYIVKGPTSMYSGERWEPETSSRRGIWSIRDDVQIPSSPYLPLNVQGSGGPSQGFLGGLEAVSAKLFQNRIIRCGGEVNDAMANYLVAQLLYLDAVDPTKDIIMYVNSPGGSVKAGMAIFDMMRHVRPDVSTVCVGLAASMGAFLLGAGTKGKRYSLPDSRIMIHQPLGGAQGFGTDIDVQADEMSHCKANLTTHLALFCGQELFKVYNDTDKDNFMSPQEAKVYGLIDGILMNPLKALRPLAASADSADE